MAAEAKPRLPIVIVTIGMAGSGKTTFLRALYAHLKSNTVKPALTSDGGDKPKSRVYTINLDPATLAVPWPCNIDIRDSIKFKDVMKQYNLGPNGAIMTCLNLFATRFNSVLDLLEKRAPELDYILIDTPGQIEVFNWSASGTIILDSLASTFPVAVAYIIDTARCERAVTFMSNMLYACSVLYKTKLPFIACFNKIDVASHEECLRWMNDYGQFADSVLKDESYMASLSRSCGLALAEFYRDLRTVGISSATGKGLDEFVRSVEKCREDYETSYVPWLDFHREQHRQKREKTAEAERGRFEADYEPKGDGGANDDDDDDGAGDRVGRCMGDIMIPSSRKIIGRARGLPPVREEDSKACDEEMKNLD